MSATATMTMEPIAGAAPRFQARIAGVLYLMCILTGTSGMIINQRLIVSGDAAATAANILAHEPLYRLGFAYDLIAGACYIAVIALLYGLFKPVSRNVSLMAALFGLAGCTCGALAGLFHLAPLAVLKGAPYLRVFSGSQLQALAFLFIKLRGQTSNIAFVFFGLYCLLIGFLIFRSAFLPRTLGVLMAIAGSCWLTSSFASFLSPPFATLLSPYIAAGGLGEAALTLWLLVIGVNGAQWEQQARGTGR